MIEWILLLLVSLVLVWILIRSTLIALKYYEATLKGERPGNIFAVKACERCGKFTSWTARLTSCKEFLLGGWTCPRCMSEYDQIGNVLVARSLDAHLRDAKSRSKTRKRLSNDDRSPIEKVIDQK